VIFPTLPLKAGATPSVFVEDTSDRGEDVMGDFSEKETEKENCTLSPSRAGSLRGLGVCGGVHPPHVAVVDARACEPDQMPWCCGASRCDPDNYPCYPPVPT